MLAGLNMRDSGLLLKFSEITGQQNSDQEKMRTSHKHTRILVLRLNLSVFGQVLVSLDSWCPPTVDLGWTEENFLEQGTMDGYGQMISPVFSLPDLMMMQGILGSQLSIYTAS